MTPERQIAQAVYTELRTSGLRTGISIVVDKKEKIIDTKGENVFLDLEGEDLMNEIINNLNVLKYDREKSH
jgi:hypothetical protein